MTDQEKPAKGEAEPAPPNEPTLTALLMHPERWALFLDIDGTLIDLAETPEAIAVPPSLPYALQALSRKLGGALALVTGRSVGFADGLFKPFHFPIAGLHGAERRDGDGRVRRAIVPAAFEEMKRAIARSVKDWPGVLVEDKGAAVAVHYRLAPEREDAVNETMQHYLSEAGPDWTLQRGKRVVEICPAHSNKGSAVEAFLEEAPFRGRRPLAIGDDVTDETMFGVANRLGGQSLRVGSPNGKTLARASIPSPARLREILEKISN